MSFRMYVRLYQAQGIGAKVKSRMLARMQGQVCDIEATVDEGRTKGYVEPDPLTDPSHAKGNLPQ